jgi:predicted nuclease of restriction endonuclease-like RecB superfamily
VRFSLQDVRKSISRRGGNLAVSLHFLQPGELQTEIASLIAYHEQLLDQPQRLFSQDEARACIGEYRQADCLIATLSYWYSWRARSWDMVVAEMGGNAALVALSPIQLRLTLYSVVNAGHGGFLTADNRRQALETFAACYDLSVSDLEALLILDSESEARLTRAAPEPPTPQEVATLYNQWAFEAALFNSSSVRFTIDCAAFARLNSADPLLENPANVESGIGTVIKRLCYLARRIGVYYDLAYEAPSAEAQGPLLSLTLYGPQDVTGVPQQYGLRLARLCRILLGYALPRNTEQPRPRKKANLSGAIVSSEALVHFSQRTYTFAMDVHLFQLLPSSTAVPSEAQSSSGSSVTADVTSLFDSSIEQIFSEAFQALASGQGVDGWRLEREPEPLLLERSIFIPDFALTRGGRRIYAEILGFWTPSYRERKIQKLQQLQGRGDLLLAIPNEAKETFAPIAEMFPIVYYDNQLGVTDVLQVLRQRYDDFAQRQESLNLVAVRAYIHEHGLLPEVDCYEQLHCYRRSEIQQAAERVCALPDGEDGEREILFLPGLGLYHRSWLRQLHHVFLPWLQTHHTAPLGEVVQALKQMQPVLQPCSEATIGTLLEMWPEEIHIRRDSIFEAVVELVVEQNDEEETSSQNEENSVVAPKMARKTGREKRASVKKRPTVEPETTQESLWS